MRQHSQARKDAVADAAADEMYRLRRLEEKGLCFNCEDNLSNPQLPTHLCADCYGDVECGQCNRDRCSRDGEVDIMYFSVCKIHAVDAAHSSIREYEKLKSRKEIMERTLHNSIGDNEELELKIKLIKEEMDVIKGKVEQVMKQVDNVWPEGYNPPV